MNVDYGWISADEDVILCELDEPAEVRWLMARICRVNRAAVRCRRAADRERPGSGRELVLRGRVRRCERIAERAGAELRRALGLPR